MPKTITTGSAPDSSSDAEKISDVSAIQPEGTADAKEAAASSTADEKQEVAKPASLLDVIKNVVKDEAEESTTTEAIDPAKESEVAKTEVSAAEKDATQTDQNAAKETDANVPFHNHPRWKAVLAERETLKTEREALRPQAEQYGLITKFMTENGLTDQEVAQGYQMMSLLKNDPAKALAALSPIVENLQRFAGKILPDDLKTKVDNGLVDEETAKTLAGERHAIAFEKQRIADAQAASVREVQNLQAQSQQAVQTSMNTAVTDWENNIKTRDADYAGIQSLVIDKARVLISQGAPKTAAEAVSLAEKAYNDVKAQIVALIPRKPTVKSSTSANSSASDAQPVPKSLKEAIRLAAQRGA